MENGNLESPMDIKLDEEFLELISNSRIMNVTTGP